MSKHFELTTDSIELSDGTVLFRIKATKKGYWGYKGTLGGYVASLDNLNGNAWVYGDAQVYGNAQVSGNARVYGDAQVSGNAWEVSPIQIQGSRHFVCEYKKGFIKIGCIEMNVSDWLKKYKAIGRIESYTDNQIKEYKLYIDLIKKVNDLRKETES